MQIGPYAIANRLAAAPMAGVTDRPFRQLCRSLGAGMTVSEMVAANPRTRDTAKSRQRLDHAGEPAPRIVQIAGSDPDQMADAARYNVDMGADIIDINMGCPAKKVCRRAAGSALLANESLVGRILAATVTAVSVPVTLKIRTGVSARARNGVEIARIAQDSGIVALAVHGRTRDQFYNGRAEYDTIRAIKSAVWLPVWANGDVDSPEAAARVLALTGADGVMIGRAACRRPWLFGDIAHFLATGSHRPAPTPVECQGWLEWLVEQLHDFYGEYRGLRIARKHIAWHWEACPPPGPLYRDLMQAESAARQLRLLRVCGSLRVDSDLARIA
ncbi:tRNA dihydrouridine synthase DusB [Spectribacter hydrogenoxidans]|uniref:tRNA-dihydrouridine synthase B n=1 Tax=Spectribacter hydrogenoxidans TaxID=3075608 RepID=A0ABU3BZJ8_9GAMM|nr:tRNA dihydrouridine synthase DusB [Salinisphaera sp. W335]MDT0634741.1 tRNA dihydrouridine synthase DusB [Salinisphaera sp. W335]